MNNLIFFHFNSNNNLFEALPTIQQKLAQRIFFYFIAEDLTNDCLLFNEKTFRTYNSHMFYSKRDHSIFQPYVLTRRTSNTIYISK